FPDPLAEEGQYSLRYAIRPDSGLGEAVTLGEELNQPLRRLRRAEELEPVARLVASGGAAGSARIQTVKLAEDRSGDLVVRLYESEGRRAEATLEVSGAASMEVVDLLERPLTDSSPLRHRAAAAEGRSMALSLKPFEITSVRVRF